MASSEHLGQDESAPIIVSPHIPWLKIQIPGEEHPILLAGHFDWPSHQNHSQWERGLSPKKNTENYNQKGKRTSKTQSLLSWSLQSNKGINTKSHLRRTRGQNTGSDTETGELVKEGTFNWENECIKEKFERSPEKWQWETQKTNVTGSE